MAYGDILLYKSGGSWYEWFITKFTHGPYVHVSVDIGHGLNISAHMKGVTVSDQPGNPEVVPVARNATPENLHVAVEWLKHQLGKHYGWLDVLSAGLHSLGINLYLGQDDHMDCSDLCATYLDILYGAEVISYKHLDIVSPNDIARKLGVLPERNK